MKCPASLRRHPLKLKLKLKNLYIKWENISLKHITYLINEKGIEKWT